MTGIRALGPADLPQVVSLYRSYLAWPHVASEEELIATFMRIFLDAPLYDPAIPSLVYEGADGEVLGFLGSQVHRMQFEGRSIRLACSSSLVVAPVARQGGAGALMLRKHLAGRQDLTITDTAGGSTEYMWKRLGGSMHHTASLTWLYPIHPLRMIVGLGLWRFGRCRWLPLARPLCWPVDAALSRWSRADAPHRVESLSDEPLSSQLLIDHLQKEFQKVRLRPDYDVGSLDWLFHEMEHARSKGRFIKKFARGNRGEPIGSYILYLLPNDICEIVQLAPSRGREELLLRHVLHTAEQCHAAAVRGRLEPWLLEVLPRRTVMFSRVRFLFHTRDEAIHEAVRAGEALMTGIEGDMWMPT
jgi:hypothetical protein